MKIFNKIRGRIPELLGVPDQTLPGVPIIEIYGDRRVLMEGHYAVVQYEDTCVRLRNPGGVICVRGCGLCMTELSSQQVIITGQIEGVSICRG